MKPLSFAKRNTSASFLLHVLLITLAYLCLTSVCHAQFNGNIEGSVQDSTGAIIPHASVSLVNTGTQISQSTTADASGNYRFISLAPGQYKITASAKGFSGTSIILTLETHQNLNVPIQLAVGAASQTVRVNSSGPILNTAESRNEMTLGTQEIETLPLQGRNMISLVVTAPGVEGLGVTAGGSPGSAPDNFSTETQTDASANGAGSVGNMYIVDGLDITSDIRPGVLNLTPNPDTIQEASIQTNTYSVDYGRASSIEMVMTTKSGTDVFHGNASDYFTNQYLWAGTEFVHNYAPFHANNISASLGGPLVPHHQAFFFGSVEPLLSLASTGNFTTTFEDPAFTAFAEKNYPTTLGTKLLETYKPTAATVTGVSQTAAQMFPTTCGTPATDNLPCDTPVLDTGVFNASNYRNGLQWNTRIDKYFKNDRIYGNFFRTTLNTGGPAIRPAFATTNTFNTNSVQVNETHTFSANTLNESYFGFLRVQGISPASGLFDVPVVNVTGVGQGFGDGFALGNFIQQNYHWRDVLTHIQGAHTLKFGYDGEHGTDLALFAPVYAQPNFQFNNLLNLVQDKPFTESGLAYDPLTGQPAKGQYEYAISTAGLFVADTWKVNNRLTLNYGLRWDDYGNPYPLSGTVLANFYPGAGLTTNQTIANGSEIQKSHVFNHSLTNVFSPRFGVAWDPTGRGVWAIHGGFGIYHNWPTLGNDENGLKGNPPGWIVPTFFAGGTTAPIFASGTQNTYPFGFPYPHLPSTTLDSKGGLANAQLNVGGIDANLTPDSSYIYTVEAQHALNSNIVASVGYSGSVSTNIINGNNNVTTTSYGRDINNFPGNLIVDYNNDVPTRLNHSFGAITYAFNQAKSHYNALIFAANGKFGKSGYFNASYTFSSSQDNAGIYPLPYSLMMGPSPWDAPNRLSLTANYEIPGFSQGKGPLGHATNGWAISDITILQSGLPFTVFTNAPFQPVLNSNGQPIAYASGSGDYNADGYNYDFPNVSSYSTPTGRQSYLHGIFSKTNFPVPAFGLEGNELSNRFRGPGYADSDITILKNTVLTQRFNFEFRFDIFDVFNRPNLTNMDSNLPDGTFGQATSQKNPRWIQIGANLTF
jgi:hypothetical protein